MPYAISRIAQIVRRVQPRSILDVGCYDKDTELLTENGWVQYPELHEGLKALCYNAEANRTEWRPIEKVIVYDYEGELYHLRNRSYDLKVTPDHKMLYDFRRDRKHRHYYKRGICRMQDMPNSDYYRLYHVLGGYRGQALKSLVLEVGRGRQKHMIRPEAYMRFLGWYLSEGWASKSGYYHKICISQSADSPHLEEIEETLEAMGLGFYRRETVRTRLKGGIDFVYIINSKGLYGWLRQFGRGAKGKRIPSQYKNARKKYLQILIDSFLKGDGSIRMLENGISYRFASSSKRLMDDLQEILLKLGLSGRISQKTITSPSSSKTSSFYSMETKIKKHTTLAKNQIKKCFYKGKIWDVNVGGQFLYVRRNGIPMVSGNSGFGKYGVIFREYLDILPGRYDKEEWQARIDGIEVHAPYITDLHRYVYDNVYETDIWEFDWPQDYDLVFMGDVIEHFAKSEGIDLLKTLRTNLVLVSTPTGVDKKKSSYRGNSHEEHKHIWTLDEFQRLDGWKIVRKGQDNYMLTILLGRE